AGQEAFAKAIEVNPAFTSGRVALGYVYNLEKKPEEALKEYNAALAQNPRDPAAVAAKVATLVEQRRGDEPAAAAQPEAKTDPKSATANELLGGVYLFKGDMASAEEQLRQAIQLDERFVPARLSMARLAVAQKKPADAVPHLQRVLKDQ